MALSRLASTIKHPKFEEEKEFRLVVDPLIRERKTSSPDRKTSGFHLKGSLVVPHANLPLDHNAELEPCDIPIVAVMVGPTAHPQLTVETVRQLLMPALVKEIAVTRTRIPFRNW
jgi:hypothetical protein